LIYPSSLEKASVIDNKKIFLNFNGINYLRYTQTRNFCYKKKKL